MVEQKCPGPVWKTGRKYCRPVWDSSQKVFVPHGKHCIEVTMMKRPNPVQAMYNVMDSVQQGSELLLLRRRVYNTVQDYQSCPGSWENNDLLQTIPLLP